MVLVLVVVLSSLTDAFGGFWPFGSGVDFALVEAGSPKAKIVRSGDPRVDADIAFFTDAVCRSTGASLPVVAAAEDGNRIVFRLEDCGLFEEDDWTVSFPDGRTMEICGTKQSCRWALNRILEDRLGVVFCMPGRNGTHYPKRRDFILKRAEMRGTASLKVERTLYGEDREWMRALGGKEQIPGCQFYNHNLHKIFPLAKYGEEPWRSKLMPLRNGKRERPSHADVFWQPCFAAQEAVPEAVKNIRAYLDAHPDEKVHSLTMNDCGGYCECEACKAMNGGTFDEKCRFGNGREKNKSSLYFTWANRVAREIAKSHPHVVLGLLAYNDTIDPPPFRLEPNLLVFLCGSIYQNGDPRIGEKRLGLMRAWSEKVAAFGVWDYPYGPAYFAPPRIYTRRTSDFFSLKNTECPSLNAYFGEGAAPFAGEGPKRYIYLRMAFDAKRDVRHELETWYRACVGPSAAPHLAAYYSIWEDFWCGEEIKSTPWYKGIVNTYMDFRGKSYLAAVTKEMLDRTDALAEKAYAAAKADGDEGQRARAARLHAFHCYYSAKMRACGAGTGFVGFNPETPADAARFFRELPALLAAQEDVMRQVDEIGRLDGEEAPSAGYAWSLKSLRRNSAQNDSIVSMINAAAAFAKDPDVRSAMRAVAEDVALPSASRELVSALSGKRGYKPLLSEDADRTASYGAWIADSIYGVSVVRSTPDAKGRVGLVATSKDGSWPAMRRTVLNCPKKSRGFRLAARVRNTSSAPLKVRMCHEALGSPSESTTFAVAPGDVRTMAITGITAYKGNYDKFYIIFNGLPKGEGVSVEGISLDDLGFTVGE